MASARTFICIAALVSACCLMTEARRLGKAREVRQTLFDFPVEQGASTGGSVPGSSVAGGSAGGGGFGAGGAAGGGFGSDIGNSGESESGESDLDMDTAELDMNEIDGADGPAMFGATGQQIGGMLLPFLRGDKGMTFETRHKEQLMKRTPGSSGRGVGIAFAVLGLLTVVVAAAAFTLRKYRHNIPVIVRV